VCHDPSTAILLAPLEETRTPTWLPSGAEPGSSFADFWQEESEQPANANADVDDIANLNGGYMQPYQREDGPNAGPRRWLFEAVCDGYDRVFCVHIKPSYF
jgi:hypothetical protein